MDAIEFKLEEIKQLAIRHGRRGVTHNPDEELWNAIRLLAEIIQEVVERQKPPSEG
jgi:hypothetical protein